MATTPHRFRRNRSHPVLRDMLADVRLHPRDLIAPLFVRSGHDIKTPVASMPGVFQMSPDVAVGEMRVLAELGVGGFILFGVTEQRNKDAVGSHGHDPDNVVCQTLRGFCAVKLDASLVAMTDLCYCEYTNHGHCGLLTAGGTVDNDATIARLGIQAVIHAKAGADIVAPSGMMDGATGAIRTALDEAGRQGTGILSYAVKYASAFYGPFRDAAESPPQFGDRKTYQMDFRRDSREAVAEALADVEQGADMLMVKPGMPYLDILRAVWEATEVPLSVYHVSGEYAMIKAAAANGWIDEKGVVLETMCAFKRAGASFILTYYAGEVARWLK